MERHLSRHHRQILITHELLLLVCHPRCLRHLASRPYPHHIRVRLQRLDLNTNTIHLPADHVELILLAALIVHNNRRVIADVSLLRVARLIPASHGHHGSHVEDHLHKAVEPEEHELAGTAVCG